MVLLCCTKMISSCCTENMWVVRVPCPRLAVKHNTPIQQPERFLFGNTGNISRCQTVGFGLLFEPTMGNICHLHFVPRFPRRLSGVQCEVTIHIIYKTLLQLERRTTLTYRVFFSFFSRHFGLCSGLKRTANVELDANIKTPTSDGARRCAAFLFPGQDTAWTLLVVAPALLHRPPVFAPPHPEGLWR